MQRILFICTGNTCRSPMAEGLLRKLAAERGLKLEVKSAGVSAVDGMPVSRHAAAILRDEGILEQGSSSPLTAELMEWADLVLTLTGSHKRYVLQVHPQAVSKVHTLKEYAQDETAARADQEELDSLYAEAELTAALGREPAAAGLQRMIELRQRIPSNDIVDPFGGSREDYEMAASEIRSALLALLDKLEKSRL